MMVCFTNMGKKNIEIFGPTNENCIWRVKTYQELQTIYNDIDVITDIKIRRLE